jgi:hypothetical protein
MDLSFPVPGSEKSIARRFHILKECPFDILLGTFVTPKPSIKLLQHLHVQL